MKVFLRSQKKEKEMMKERLLDLERLALSRKEAMKYYARHVEERSKTFDIKLASKSIMKGSLVLLLQQQI